MWATFRSGGRQRRFALALAVLAGLAGPAVAAPSRIVLDEYMKWQGFPAPRLTGRTLSYSAGGHTLAFDLNSRRMVYNERVFYLNHSLIQYRNRWAMARCDLDNGLDALLHPSRVLVRQALGLVVLDPGHGGEDSGATGVGGVVEKYMTLDIARRVARKLRASGVSVQLTRDDDQALTLDERSNRARRWQGSLFVSIHLNSTSDRAVSGAESYSLTAPGAPSTAAPETHATEGATYTGNRYDAASLLLARFVQEGLLYCGQMSDRGVKKARFAVLKSAPCPAALAECGFLSNRQEERKILQKAYRDALAEGLARGILTYIVIGREAQQRAVVASAGSGLGAALDTAPPPAP